MFFPFGVFILYLLYRFRGNWDQIFPMLSGVTVKAPTLTLFNLQSRAWGDHKNPNNLYVGVSNNPFVKDLGVLIPDDTMALQGRIHGKSYQPFRLGLTGSTSEKLANASLRGFYRPELNMGIVSMQGIVKSTPEDVELIVKDRSVISENPEWFHWMACMTTTDSLLALKDPVLCYRKRGFDMPKNCVRIELRTVSIEERT